LDSQFKDSDLGDHKSTRIHPSFCTGHGDNLNLLQFPDSL